MSVMLLLQEPAPFTSTNPADTGFTLSVGTRLVEIPVTVLSADGMRRDNLLQSNFEVFEDNVRQDITLFKHEDTPIRAGVVIAASRTPDTKAVIDNAAGIFIRESNPGNRTFIVDYSQHRQELSKSIGALVEAFIEVDTFRRTPPPVGPGSVRKAAVVIIEGDIGPAGVSQLLTYLEDARDVAIYAIGLSDPKMKSLSKLTRERLTRAADATGGQVFFPASVDEVTGLCLRIAHDLRNQYTLGYSPKNANNDGSWRSIRVTVTAPQPQGRPLIRAKQGYFASPF